jgi:Secretion system C-terminal sorting domain
MRIDAQYIAEVMEYKPAPGQFINSMPWACPVSANSLVGGINGSLSLGAFGGYVVFGFEQAVENHKDNPYGIDFSIFGNPTSEWSEPGVVWVMKDLNKNGLPDDTWYELAGSDYYFSSTRKEYQVSYSNPGGSEAADVPWSDLLGNRGKIRANSAHTQPYYPLIDSFPNVPRDTYTLRGTQIRGVVNVDHPPFISSRRRAFGYADNQVRGSGSFSAPDNPYTPEVENSGGDAFDISWAVNGDGVFMDLDSIHFVKVQNGVLHEGGWLGEISTELTGAVDVMPDPGLSGKLDLLVFQDLPLEIDTGSIQLELFLFHGGRPVELPQIMWELSEDWARVDEEHLLSVSGQGPLTLKVSVSGDTSLQCTASTLVTPGITAVTPTATGGDVLPELWLYPNPAEESIYIRGLNDAEIYIYDLSGKVVLQQAHYQSGNEVKIHLLPPGIYLLKLVEGSLVRQLKFLKR